MAHIHGLLLAEFEAAEMLHNSLALESLTESDAVVVVHNRAADLSVPDPGEAVRARSAAVAQATGLGEPDVVAETYLVCAAVLQL